MNKQKEDELIQYICGVHFCDQCGDCMYCYGGDPCIDGEDHYYDPTEEDKELECSGDNF